MKHMIKRPPIPTVWEKDAFRRPTYNKIYIFCGIKKAHR